MIRAGATRAVVAVLRGLARLFDGFLLTFLGLRAVVLLRLLRLVLRVFLRFLLVFLGFLRRTFDDLALVGLRFLGFAFLRFLRLVGLRRFRVGLDLIAFGIRLLFVLEVLEDAVDQVAYLVSLLGRD